MKVGKERWKMAKKMHSITDENVSNDRARTIVIDCVHSTIENCPVDERSDSKMNSMRNYQVTPVVGF